MLARSSLIDGFLFTLPPAPLELNWESTERYFPYNQFVLISLCKNDKRPNFKFVMLKAK